MTLPMIRIEGGPTPAQTRVTLDGETVPGVQRVEIVIDAMTGESYAVLRFAYVDLGLDVPLRAAAEDWT